MQVFEILSYMYSTLLTFMLQIVRLKYYNSFLLKIRYNDTR